MVIYVAFDGEEFNNAERCREYEQAFSNSLMKIKEAYTFYNSKGDIIPIATYDMETMLEDLEAAYQESAKIVVRHNVPHRTLKYFYDTTGIPLPEDAGIYRYDFKRYTWESVSEYDF